MPANFLGLDSFVKMGAELYVYCTDFLINLANLTHTSYYEVNFLIFCVLLPLLFVLLPLLALLLKVRLVKLRAQYAEAQKSSGEGS